MDFGSPSILVRIDAPVVENPEIVSKKALVNDGIEPEMTNGRHPNSDAQAQLRATKRNPSFVLNALPRCFRKMKSVIPDIRKIMTILMVKP